MAIRPIVIHGNPVLHRPAAPVTEFNDELKELVADMYETMDASNGVVWRHRRSVWYAHLHLQDGE